jgi:hypothetical protein
VGVRSGRGRAMVSGGGMVVVVALGCCCSWVLGCCLVVLGGRCWWVGDGRSGDDRSGVGDGGGGGVMVGWCGGGVGVVLSVVVGPTVTFVRHYRHCLSSRPTPVALLRGAIVVVIVRVVVRG